MRNFTNPARLLLVDDHPLFIDGLKILLTRNTNLKIAGEALNGNHALEIIKKKPVDIVISDINMPIISGTELTKMIKAAKPDIKVLILTMHKDKEIIHEIISSEAEGFVLKSAEKKELLDAIEKIVNGGTYYSNEVLDIISRYNLRNTKNSNHKTILTKREREILHYVCQEYSTPEIADKLFISPLTVETHRKNILKKTNTKTIVGLIKYAIENGIA